MPAIFHVKVVDDSFQGPVQHIIEAQPNDAVVWHCEEADANFDGAIFHVKWAAANFDGPVWRVLGIARSIVVVIGPAPSPLSLPDAIANSLSYVKAFGGTEQRLLPDTYELYTSVEANGITYEYSSQNLTQIPCKRIADNVFGLYNYTTKVFISEV